VNNGKQDRKVQTYRLRSVAAVAVAGSLLAISACGSSSSDNGESKKKGPAVADDAFAALKKAGSVHIAGETTTTDGKKTTLDLTLLTNSGTGDITNDGQKLSLVNVDGVSYGKAAAGFYTAQGVTTAIADKVADKWVKLPASAGFDTFTLTKFAESLEQSDDKKIDDNVTKGDVDGDKAVIVTQKDGSKLFVASTGDPTPLKISGTTKEPGDLNFSDYGKKVDVTAPADAIDIPTS
jgi:hypothetical protein